MPANARSTVEPTRGRPRCGRGADKGRWTRRRPPESSWRPRQRQSDGPTAFYARAMAVNPGRYTADIEAIRRVPHRHAGQQAVEAPQVVAGLRRDAADAARPRQHPELGCLGSRPGSGARRSWCSTGAARGPRPLRPRRTCHTCRRGGASTGSSARGRRRHLARDLPGARRRIRSVYGNMPVFGLAAAGRHIPAGRKAQTAAARSAPALSTTRPSRRTDPLGDGARRTGCVWWLEPRLGVVPLDRRL